MPFLQSQEPLLSRTRTTTTTKLLLTTYYLLHTTYYLLLLLLPPPLLSQPQQLLQLPTWLATAPGLSLAGQATNLASAGAPTYLAASFNCLAFLLQLLKEKTRKNRLQVVLLLKRKVKRKVVSSTNLTNQMRSSTLPMLLYLGRIHLYLLLTHAWQFCVNVLVEAFVFCVSFHVC